MPAPERQDITANGTYKLCGRSSHSAYATPQVQISGTGWSGSLVFAVMTAPNGGVQPGTEASNITTLAYKEAGNYFSNLIAGTPLVRNGAWEFNTGGLPLWVTITNLLGAVTITTIPDAVPTPQPNTINLSTGLNLDAVPVGYPEDLALLLRLASDGAMQG